MTTAPCSSPCMYVLCGQGLIIHLYVRVEELSASPAALAVAATFYFLAAVCVFGIGIHTRTL